MNDLCGRICSSPALVAALAVSILAGPAYGQGKAPDMSGTYWATQYNAKVQLVGGGELPLTAKGKEAYEKNMAGLKDGSITDDARKYCTPGWAGRETWRLPTRSRFSRRRPARSRSSTSSITRSAWSRSISRTPKYEELVAYPFYNGHAFGRWDGDTLVVETLGFNEKTYLDATGAPHTDELVTTERIRKISPTELEIVVNVHDPDYYTRDWQARFVYTLRNDVRLEDYVCGEPHRDIASVAGVRRP